MGTKKGACLRHFLYAPPFDGLLAFAEAASLWPLNESTLRKAIAIEKLQNGVDACKYGKQRVVSNAAMIREYGVPAANK